MSIKTPLSKVRGLGSARDGTTHFWHQRLTAVANIPLLIALLVIVITLVGSPHAEVAKTLGQPVVTIIVMLGIVSICYHMHLGMKVIIEDYVHGELAKIACLMGNTFFSIFVAFASLYAILKLSFGV